MKGLGKVYISIKEFAAYIPNYDALSGEYKEYIEDNTKCQVKSESEVTSYILNSAEVYKAPLSESNRNYEYFT